MISISNIFEVREWTDSETEFMRKLGDISRTGKTKQTKAYGLINLRDFMAKKSRAIKNKKQKQSLRSGAKQIYNRIDIK